MNNPERKSTMKDDSRLNPTGASRRGFLRGVLLAGTAGALAPAAVAEGLVPDTAGVAMLTHDRIYEPVPRSLVDRIVPDLIARINAHQAVTGEVPKLLLVNRYELRALTLALTPTARYQHRGMADRGIGNLMIKNVPVASVDNDTIGVVR